MTRGAQAHLIAKLGERAIVMFLFTSAAVAGMATIAIFLTLVLNGVDFFGEVGIAEFLFGTTWAPDFFPRQFGSVPLLKGTFLIGTGASLIGVPIGVGTAIYLSEFAPDRIRRVLKPAIELLAGIPSIIFAIIAIFLISPFIIRLFPSAGYQNALNAMIMLGVMVVPIITTLAEDALRAVPREIREGSYALGATKWETTWRSVVPSASSGITAAVLLGFSRAIGETMVVVLAAGSIPTMTLNILQPSETITAFIAARAAGDLPTGSVEYLSIFAVGTVLFVLTFIINVIAQYVLARQRRRFG